MQAPKKPRNEDERQAELESFEVLDTEAEVTYDNLTQILAEYLDVPISLVSFVDKERQWFKSNYGLAATETSRDISFCGHVVETGRMLLVSDAQKDPRFADNPLVLGDPSIRFYAGCPLVSPSGHVLGTLCAIDKKPRELTEKQRRVLELIANQVELNLELRRRTREATVYKVRIEETTQLLSGMTAAQVKFIDGAKPSDVFEDLLGQLLRLTKSEYGFIGDILTKADGSPYLKTQAITNISWNVDTRKFYEANKVLGMEFYNLKTLFGRVITEKRSLISNDPYSDPRRGGLPPGHPEMRCFLGIPVMKNGAMLGMLAVANRKGGYDADLIEFLGPFTRTCATILTAHRATAERQKSEAALNDSTRHLAAINAELARSNEDLSQFAYIASHDLQAPLRHIATYAEIITEELAGNASADVQEALTAVNRSVSSMRSMIDDLLTYASIGNSSLATHPVKLTNLVQEVLETLKDTLEDANGTVVVRELPVLACDQSKMMQVFMNLIQNALKYRSENVNPIVTVYAVPSEVDTIIAIEDNGMGIPPEHRDRIFKMFQRLAGGGKVGGTGIGLAICKKVTELHGGRIWVDGNKGPGSTFFISFPRRH